VQRIDAIIDRCRTWIDAHWNWFGFASAYLIGLFVNAQSDPTLKTTGEVVRRFLDVHTRPLNWLTMLALGTFIGLPALRYGLRRYARSHAYAVRLAAIYSARVDPVLLPFHKGRIAWGPELVLQSCPDLRAGWQPHEIEIKHEGTRYVIPEQLKEAYASYFNQSRSHGRFRTDKVLLRVKANPDSFSDRPTLFIEVDDN